MISLFSSSINKIVFKNKCLYILKHSKMTQSSEITVSKLSAVKKKIHFDNNNGEIILTESI